MGSNREDGGCRNGVAFWASFLRNNDSRRVDDSVGFNAQRAIHHWDMKGRRRRAPLGRLLCATGALASRALQSLAAGVALCRRVCSISGARSLDCLPFFPPPLSFPLLLPHCPFPILSFRARFLARFPACVRLSRRLAGRIEKFLARPAGWLLGRRNLEPFALGMAGRARAGGPVLLEMGWRRRGAGKNCGIKEWPFAILFFAL